MKVMAFAWSIFWAPLWLLLLHPWWRRRQKKDLWVVGGHRGRNYADNAGAVHAEARRQGREAVFIARRELSVRLNKEGVPVLRQGSFAARRAISQAAALVYSHGEDDLDPLLILLRGRTSARVYLNHSLNLMKAGGVTDPRLSQAGWLSRRVKMWLMTDCDWLLFASPEERTTFEQCYPQHRDKLVPGGGAHLDSWFQGANLPVRKRIFWFPTFRDTQAGNALLRQQIKAVLANRRLRDWLVQQGYEFVLGIHINRAEEGELKPPFRQAKTESLVEEIRQSALLVSDYSGVVFDFLALERPQVLFAFDLVEYQKTRFLLVDYSSLDFALHPRSVDELVACLVEERFMDSGLRERAREARVHYLPAGDGHFARASVGAIAQAGGARG